MNKLISTIAVAVLMSGCAPMIGLTQPIFPAVPPEKPKSEPESPKSRATDRKPVTAKEITERNAQQILRELDAELEIDSSDKPAKN